MAAPATWVLGKGCGGALLRCRRVCWLGEASLKRASCGAYSYNYELGSKTYMCYGGLPDKISSLRRAQETKTAPNTTLRCIPKIPYQTPAWCWYGAAVLALLA